ncbi:MAG: GrdX family protein [Andreesenia angusta]|nr:GrdX family protein [Andreesenia angusta]
MVIIISNNRNLKEENIFECEFEYVDGDFIDVLYKVRDKVQLGYKLISHPLGASIRMFFSPVKSIVVSDNNCQLDLRSISIIESSIEKYKNTMQNRNIDYSNEDDYEKIDIELLKAVFKEIKNLKS